jgi:hypothetical protein
VFFDWDFKEEGFCVRSPKFQQTFRFELVEVDFGLGLRRGRIFVDSTEELDRKLD